jgi:hypothetical protein
LQRISLKSIGIIDLIIYIEIIEIRDNSEKGRGRKREGKKSLLGG